MDKLNAAVGILGLLGTILGLLAAFYSIRLAFRTNRLFSDGVKNGVLIQLKTMIDRMEADKKNHQAESPAWHTMQHTQEQLEATRKTIEGMFFGKRE